MRISFHRTTSECHLRRQPGAGETETQYSNTAEDPRKSPPAFAVDKRRQAIDPLVEMQSRVVETALGRLRQRRDPGATTDRRSTNTRLKLDQEVGRPRGRYHFGRSIR